MAKSTAGSPSEASKSSGQLFEKQKADAMKQEKESIVTEGEEQIAIMKEVQGKSLRDLQKESLRIEENVLIAQKRVQFQRSQLQKKLQEAMEAKHLDERNVIQRKKLNALQDQEDVDKKRRKGFKRAILELFEDLKLKTTECYHLLESRSRRNALRRILLEKRSTYQSAAKELEVKEKEERQELQESHDRSSKNLLIWQELNMRHVSQDKSEGLIRVNRLMAQQLREIQRKEAEQLRELQHMKAKFKLSEFDAELEFVAVLEMKRASQLFERNTKSLSLKKERREAKKNIVKLREQAKVANNMELNALKAKQLKLIEENRARELKELQRRDAKRNEEGFEQEIAMMEADMKELLSSEDFDMNTFGSRSANTGSASRTDGSMKSESGTEGAGTAASGATDDSDTYSGSHKSSELEQKMLLEDEKEFKKKLDDMREQAQIALQQAEHRLHEVEKQNEEVSTLQVSTHESDLKRVQVDYEEKRNIVRKMNEDEVMHLLKQHAKEKLDIQNAHARELKSLENWIELESKLHQSSLHKSQVASQAKSEFLSFVCHELRNPLSAIVAVVDMLLSNNQMDTDTQEHIQSVKQESELMCAIVNDVLDFAKIEARMLVLEPVDFNIHNMVHDLVREQKLSAKKTRPNIALDYSIGQDVPELVHTDPVRIRQVLLNLVSNAVKFTFQGSITVILKAGTATGPEEMMLEFSVKDTGVGIDKDNLEHIFAAFSQAKPSITREFGGTGLGLSISKSLVERLGGKIGVESVKDEGTTFSFSVKVKIVNNNADEEEEEEEEEEEQMHFPQGIDLLIVEDSATLRRLWCKLLKEQGCIVQAAGNGQEALDKCAEKKYDVVLMDITMPVMTGDEAVKRLRDLGWDGVVIALTANAMETDKQKYLEAGMDAVLTKPCKMDNLKNVMVDWLIKRNNPIVKK